MSIEQNKALVRRLFETLNDGLEAMTTSREEIFTPDDTVHLPGQSLDHEAHKQFDQMLLTAFPDVHLTVEDFISEGDKVVARFTVRGIQKGEFQGIAATSKSVTVTGVGIYRLAGGKITEQWLEYDQLGMLQQLGVIPAPGQSGS